MFSCVQRCIFVTTNRTKLKQVVSEQLSSPNVVEFVGTTSLLTVTMNHFLGRIKNDFLHDASLSFEGNSCFMDYGMKRLHHRHRRHHRHRHRHHHHHHHHHLVAIMELSIIGWWCSGAKRSINNINGKNQNDFLVRRTRWSSFLYSRVTFLHSSFFILLLLLLLLL